MVSWMKIFLLLLVTAAKGNALVIPYFAYGSNVYSTTMTAFRGIQCVDSTAAVLQGYKLRFNLPGMPAVEPSWACVDKDSTEIVHGVLYTLTPQDFAKVSISEGVPFGYQWEKVEVVPYQGDGKEAGQTALLSSKPNTVQAYTLVSQNPFLPNRDIPPSKGYLDLLIQGAMEYKMDQSQIRKLKATPVGFTFFGEGYVSKTMLEAAERQMENKKKKRAR